MIMVYLKVAIVEALRDVFDAEFQSDGNNKPFPRRISIEYAVEPQDWPFILVQVHPTNIRWTGIDPDEEVDADSPPILFPTVSIRQGYCEGSCDLQVLALTSEERDRMWDTLVELFLMGRRRSVMDDFFSSFENQDLIGITVQEGTIQPIGDVVGQGTPWHPEELTYEATLRFNFIAQFWADSATRALVPFSEVKVYPYIPDAGETPPGENDGQGEWSLS